MVDAIDQHAERIRADRHDVAGLVGEALAGLVAVLHRRELGAEEQHGAVRILVRAIHRLGGKIQRIAADVGQMAFTGELVAVGTGDLDLDVRAAQVVDAVVLIEQADERTDGTTGVVVLRLAQQQRAAPLEIAQVDVVAERGADHTTGAIDRQHDFGFRIVPGRVRAHADFRAKPDGGHGLRFVEHLCIRPDADFQVL